MAKLKIKPLGDRVLVEPAEEAEVKKGGIIIPDSAKEKPQESKVIALGTGRTDDNGDKVPFEVSVGDIVLTNKYGGTEIKIDGVEYKIQWKGSGKKAETSWEPEDNVMDDDLARRGPAPAPAAKPAEPTKADAIIAKFGNLKMQTGSASGQMMWASYHFLSSKT